MSVIVAATAAIGASFTVAFGADAPPGSIDKSFGHAGRTIVTGGIPTPYPIDAETMPDGSILVLGRTEWGPTWSAPDAYDPSMCSHVPVRASTWTLTRFRPNGRLDKQFGERGIVKFRFPHDRSAIHWHEPGWISVQSDGKILVSGTIDTIADNIDEDVKRSRVSSRTRASDSDCAMSPGIGHSYVGGVVRLTRSGRVDRTYGSRGTALLERQHVYRGHVAVDRHDRLYVADTVSGGRQAEVFRLTRSGRIDRSFGTRGGAEFPGRGRIDSIAVDSRGRLVAMSESVIRRYSRDGDLDARFAANASRARDAVLTSVYEIARVGNGIALIGNQQGYAARLLLLRSDGTANSGFADNGVREFGEGIGSSVYETRSGQIVAGWLEFDFEADGRRWRVARLDKNGAVDPSFDATAMGFLADDSSEEPNIGPHLIVRPIKNDVLVTSYANRRQGVAGTARVLVRLKG